MELAIGTTGSVERVVANEDLATQYNREPGDAFPPVFATSAMVGLMEMAAARAMHPLLAAGELSVGVTVDVLHSAATPPGVNVRAEAKFTGKEGKLYVFEVMASDPGGEIGRGIHKRAIIAAARLAEGAARRTAAV